LWLLGFWIVMGIAVAVLAANKGRFGFPWFIYGFLLWPVALIHAAVMSPTADAYDRKMRQQNRVPCPHCAEYIPQAAKLCPQCRSELEEGWSKPKPPARTSQPSQTKPPQKREPSLDKPKRSDDRFMDHRGK